MSARDFCTEEMYVPELTLPPPMLEYGNETETYTLSAAPRTLYSWQWVMHRVRMYEFAMRNPTANQLGLMCTECMEFEYQCVCHLEEVHVSNPLAMCVENHLCTTHGVPIKVCFCTCICITTEGDDAEMDMWCSELAGVEFEMPEVVAIKTVPNIAPPVREVYNSKTFLQTAEGLRRVAPKKKKAKGKVAETKREGVQRKKLGRPRKARYVSVNEVQRLNAPALSAGSVNFLVWNELDK